MMFRNKNISKVAHGAFEIDINRGSLTFQPQ